MIASASIETQTAVIPPAIFFVPSTGQIEVSHVGAV
jgi:hypothetical protein